MSIFLLKSKKLIYLKIYPIISKYKNKLNLLLIINILYIFVNLSNLYLYSIIINNVIFNKELKIIPYIIIGYIIVYLFETTLMIYENKLKNNVFYKIKIEMKKKILKKYNLESFEFFEKYSSSDLIKRIDTDIDNFEKFIYEQVIQYNFYLISTIILMFMLLFISWKLTIISCLAIPISYTVNYLMSKKVGYSWEKIRIDNSIYEDWLQNNLSNWKEIKTLNCKENQLENFEKLWKNNGENFKRASIYSSLNRSFISFLDLFTTNIGLYFLGGIFIFLGKLSVKNLILFIKYYDYFFKNIINISNNSANLKQYNFSLERVVEFLDSENIKCEISKIIDIYGDIKFESVSYKYNKSENLALKNINVCIKQNDLVAIVGKSGSGKTTFIKLLLKMCKLEEGTILLNNLDITSINSNILYNHIGVVMQDSYFFNTSILENLRLGNKNASYEDIVEVCKKVNLHETIKNMPNGYDSIIGEKGVKLSGGEKQRLAIARVILRNVNVLILDEATSALDSNSEKVIKDIIKNIKGKITIIIIAHRLHTILDCNKIIVFERGEIVSEGEYKELINKDYYFSKLFKKQLL